MTDPLRSRWRLVGPPVWVTCLQLLYRNRRPNTHGSVFCRPPAEPGDHQYGSWTTVGFSLSGCQRCTIREGGSHSPPEQQLRFFRNCPRHLDDSPRANEVLPLVAEARVLGHRVPCWHMLRSRVRELDEGRCIDHSDASLRKTHAGRCEPSSALTAVLDTPRAIVSSSLRSRREEWHGRRRVAPSLFHDHVSVRQVGPRGGDHVIMGPFRVRAARGDRSTVANAVTIKQILGGDVATSWRVKTGST